MTFVVTLLAEGGQRDHLPFHVDVVGHAPRHPPAGEPQLSQPCAEHPAVRHGQGWPVGRQAVQRPVGERAIPHPQPDVPLLYLI
jgi:hypothetical protein